MNKLEWMEKYQGGDVVYTSGLYTIQKNRSGYGYGVWVDGRRLEGATTVLQAKKIAEQHNK